VPSDYGLAAFIMAGAALLNSYICLRGYFDDQWPQADGHIMRILLKMGVTFNERKKDKIVIEGPFILKGGKFSLKDFPDLVPIISVLALFADSKTILCDIAHARVKESDRISDLRNELLKVGANIEEKQDQLIINPTYNHEYKEGVELDPHKDHRLAMAFSILGLKLPVFVKDIECVKKSYPDFVRDLKKLKAKVQIVRTVT